MRPVIVGAPLGKARVLRQHVGVELRGGQKLEPAGEHEIIQLVIARELDVLGEKRVPRLGHGALRQPCLSAAVVRRDPERAGKACWVLKPTVRARDYEIVGG